MEKCENPNVQFQSDINDCVQREGERERENGGMRKGGEKKKGGGRGTRKVKKQVIEK